MTDLNEQFQKPTTSGFGEQFDNWFVYHAPNAEQIPKYNELREAAKTFAETIMRLTPNCADQSAAIRYVRNAVMTANAAIAIPLKGDSK
jgi:hypothetical protein